MPLDWLWLRWCFDMSGNIRVIGLGHDTPDEKARRIKEAFSEEGQMDIVYGVVGFSPSTGETTWSRPPGLSIKDLVWLKYVIENAIDSTIKQALEEHYEQSED